MRIAVIADVHGDLIALEAVLAQLRNASPDLIVNLGDLVSGPFDPAGWAAELRAVPYDHEAAARQAEQAGRPGVAHMVRTGRMPAG